MNSSSGTSHIWRRKVSLSDSTCLLRFDKISHVSFLLGLSTVFCKNARTMLAMAAAAEEKNAPKDKDIAAAAAEEELSPIPLQQPEPAHPPHAPPMQQQPPPYLPHHEFSPPRRFEGEHKVAYGGGFPMVPYGGASSLQMLEQHMQSMPPYMGHNPPHTYNNSPPTFAPPPGGANANNHEQFLQMQRMMQIGMQHQRTRKPHNGRANAA